MLGYVAAFVIVLLLLQLKHLITMTLNDICVQNDKEACFLILYFHACVSIYVTYINKLVSRPMTLKAI